MARYMTHSTDTASARWSCHRRRQGLSALGSSRQIACGGDKDGLKREEKGGIAFFIGNMSHSGGTERVLCVLANGLAGRGFPVSIMSLWGKGESFFSLDGAVKVYWIERENPGRGVIGNIRVLERILNRERPAFLVDVDIILGLYSFLLRRQIPQMHWISWEHFNYHYHFRANRLLRRIARELACRFSDRLVVLTREDKGYYEKSGRLKCRVDQIYDPDPFAGKQGEEKKTGRPDTVGSSFRASGEERRDARLVLAREYGERSGIVLAAGRLTPEKGFDLLLESWAMLEKKYPRWELVIVGEGEQRKALERRIHDAELMRVRLAGTVSDMEACYREAAFFVLSSRDEGFGMVLIEAMHFSCPVVSYACRTGPREIITDGGDGFLVEPGDVTGFAEKMELLMKDGELRGRMGERAAESVKRFEPEGILDRWERVFEEVAERHPPVG